MKRRTRWLLGVVAALVLAFGLLCLNYTAADGIEHHRQAAARYNLWPPSHRMFLGGVAATALGAGSLGFVLGHRPSV